MARLRVGQESGEEAFPDMHAGRGLRKHHALRAFHMPNPQEIIPAADLAAVVAQVREQAAQPAP